MSLFRQLGRVRAAQAEMGLARTEFNATAAALLARGEQYPLTTVGAAAGAGFLLGRHNVHPLRVPGVSSLVGGGLAEAVAYGARLLSDMGAFDFFGSEKVDSGKNEKGSDGASTGQDSGIGQPS
jgi:hypothetical protein